MTEIDRSTQLSTFPLLRDAILANSILAEKFNVNNIYEYEPKQKSSGFKGFPYIWINIPFYDSGKTVFDNSFVQAQLAANIYLRVEWEARDNFRKYANAILEAIPAKESTYQAEGYYDVLIDLLDVDPNTVIDQKELVEGIFEVTWHGQVTR